MYLNKVFIFGNLTRDPEIRSIPSGMMVASFSVATNRVWKKDGAKQESVEYHNVVAFGKSAELISQYLKKGDSILVEGRIQTRSWDDKTSGEKKYRTEIVADSFQFGPRTGGGGGAPGTTAKGDASAGDAGAAIDYPEEDINPEDIPF